MWKSFQQLTRTYPRKIPRNPDTDAKVSGDPRPGAMVHPAAMVHRYGSRTSAPEALPLPPREGEGSRVAGSSQEQGCPPRKPRSRTAILQPGTLRHPSQVEPCLFSDLPDPVSTPRGTIFRDVEIDQVSLPAIIHSSPGTKGME